MLDRVMADIMLRDLTTGVNTAEVAEAKEE